MRKFRADLHIHSRFSRATSKQLNPWLLAAWAGVKGLDVLGTGDFTHPGWRQELKDLLTLEEGTGLYILKDQPAVEGHIPRHIRDAFPGGLKKPLPVTRFMLQAEISSIYKQDGKVRKVHNLVYMPDFESAEKFSKKLEQIGNLHSDGRPILGLNSRSLLEIALETNPKGFLVPAHVWTPWFSVFGSKSGFDSLGECFGDLAGEIFALETGLSSDPPMNRLVSGLDQCRLISNSDAHSGENLGREANLFSGEMSYDGILSSLKGRAGRTRFLGTIEFFPEEGKYHLDGHRKCNVVLSPEETKKLKGICPVCRNPLTVGVLHRVMDLADRQTPRLLPDESCEFLVPLPEIFSEILQVGPKSGKVGAAYADALARFGSELDILLSVPEDELARYFPALGVAIGRMRRNEVIRQGGYDGEYGTVRVFSPEELKEISRAAGPAAKGGKAAPRAQRLSLMDNLPSGKKAGSDKMKNTTCMAEDSATETVPTGPGQQNAPIVPNCAAGPACQADPVTQSGSCQGDDFLFSALEDGPEAFAVGQMYALPEDGDDGSEGTRAVAPEDAGAPVNGEGGDDDDFQEGDGLNPEQECAILAGPMPVLVLAGPGSGKTRTLVARIMRLLDEGISTRHILAVTFTRRAATEMDHRLRSLLGKGAPLPRTDTLHALALELWHRVHSDVPVLLSEESARRVFREANPDQTAATLKEAWAGVNLAREKLEPLPREFAVMGENYFKQKAAWNLADYTDLLEFWREQIISGLYSSPWEHVLVDEIQDLSMLQLSIVRSLLSASGEGFFGIGDPDQAIYGFRGAHGKCLDYFSESWPGIKVVSLKRNYRSCAGILKAAAAVMDGHGVSGPMLARRAEPALMHIFSAPDSQSEAAWVAERIQALVGGGSHTLADSSSPGQGDYTPGDIAVLVRTHSLAGSIRKALDSTGLPVSEPESDVFWSDPRVALIINAAGRMLGIASPDEELDSILNSQSCPDSILAKGPLGVSAYFDSIAPFDALFWKSSAFRALVKAYDQHGGWAEVITWINLQNEMELPKAMSEKVQVLSMHAAKGLEFKAVFLPCLEDGILPFAGAELLTGKIEKGAGVDADEERRLFYVALTRARDALFISHSAKRRLYGRELRLKPSRFLAVLPKNLFTRSALVGKVQRKESQLKLL